MTELEKAKSCRRIALTSWGEVNQYDWSPEFCKEEIKGKADGFLDRHSEYEINLNNLSESDLDELEFGKWSEESNLRLIPIWLKPFCKNTEVISISGEKVMLDEADNDHRFGCLAFGVKK